MKLYLSDFTQNPQNNQYPHRVEINGLEDLKRAVVRDHVAPEMKNSHRGNDDFLNADCVMLDLDNTHSEDPAEWKTVDDVADAFPDVMFYYIQSRNYMKLKTKTAKDGTVTNYEPREKYHFYFPLARTYTSLKGYERLMLTAAGLFPFLDLGAAKPAQFFFGVHNPVGGVVNGSLLLDQFLEQPPQEAVVKAVTDFADKVKQGIYKADGETAKAARKLLGYFGIGVQPDQQEAQRGSGPIPAGDTEEYSDFGRMIETAERQKSETWFLNFAQQHNIALGRRYEFNTREHPGAVAYCVTCPWEDKHTEDTGETQTVVIIEQGGRLSFLCRHSHGYMYSWKDYRAYYERRDSDRINSGWQEHIQQRAAEAPEKAVSTSGDVQQWQTDKAPGTGAQSAQPGPEGQAAPLPGLLTYSDAVNIFETADNSFIELKSFPVFSQTAKIKRHDSIVIAADTGGGKSSLAINLLNDLNEQFPCIYFNLEMDQIDVMRRLVAIHSGIELDRIEGYQNDQQTATAVNVTLEALTKRKPLQIIQGAYLLEDVQRIIEVSTKGREEPTAVFIDHSLLLDTQRTYSGRYDRFTQVSEMLRKTALRYNVILFVLLQQNRAGKAQDDEKPKNSSLKESGSWENDATHICFLWYENATKKKKLLLTKNRHGDQGEFYLNYWKRTQLYTEAKDQYKIDSAAGRDFQKPQSSRREKQREKLQSAYILAQISTNGKPTLRAMAEAADVTTTTIKGWIKEYGGCTVDGKQVDPAGIDTEVEYTGFIKLTPSDGAPFEDDAPAITVLPKRY